MSGANDPMRLLDGSDPDLQELRRGLHALRLHGPSPEQRARMRHTLGLPPARPGTIPAISNAQRWSALLKLALSAALLTSGIALLHRQRSDAPIRERPPATVPAMIPSAQPGTPAVPGPAAIAPAQAAHKSSDPRSERSPRRPRVSNLPDAPPVADSTLATPPGELALLARARAHAHSAPAQALELIAEHERLYRRTAFAEEREVIAVEALLGDGRVEPARARATRFFVRFPSSAHARRVRSLLEADLDKRPVTPPHAQ